MEYNINSVGIQYNSFVNYNQPFYNLVSNSNTGHQSQCIPSNQSFIESVFPSTIQNCVQQRKVCLHRQHFATTLSSMTSPSTKLSSTFTIDSILGNKNHENLSIPSSPSETNTTKNINSNNEGVLYNWLRCTRYKPPKVKSKNKISDH